MKNLRPFQIALLAFFTALGVGSVILLAAYQASSSKEAKIYGNSVVIWGTLDQTIMGQIKEQIVREDDALKVVSYRQFNESTFEEQLISSIAEGRGPDLIILPAEKMVSLRAKLYPISYETLPLRTFRNNYVDGAEIFTFPEGVYAIPMLVDPLVMYWNRDLLAANGLAEPPATWEQVVNSLVPRLSSFDNRRTIIRSAIAFGEFRNLVNPKAILLTLAMQSGSQLVTLNESGYSVGLDRHVDTNSDLRPLQLTMEFFTDFSNSNSQLYTWNRIQPLDKNAFIAGDLAVYFGFISEFADITGKNPNLNFDVAPIPQGETATVKRVYADFYGLAIPRSSGNIAGAYQAANQITSRAYSSLLAESYGMVSPRRDVVAAGSLDPVVQIALDSVLVARGWLDPAAASTNQIFQTMVEDVVSNRVRIDTAISEALERLRREF